MFVESHDVESYNDVILGLMNNPLSRIIFLVPRFHTNLQPIARAMVNQNYSVYIYPWKKSSAEIRANSKKLYFEDNTLSRVLHFGKFQITLFRFISMYRLLKMLNRKGESFRIFARCELSIFGICSLILIVLSRVKSKTVIYTQYPIEGKRLHHYIWITLIKNILGLKYFSQVFKNADYAQIDFQDVAAYLKWIRNVLDAHKDFIPFAIPSLFNRSKTKSHTIISVGKAQERKGLIEIVKIFRKLLGENQLNHSLVLVVQVNNAKQLSYFIRLRESCADLLKKKRLQIYLNLNVEQTRNLIATSDCLVLNSTREPASFVQLEALALGVPIILNRSNGNSYVLPNGLGIMKIRTAEELEWSIKEMIWNLERNRLLIGEVKPILRDLFSDHEVACRWIEV